MHRTSAPRRQLPSRAARLGSRLAVLLVAAAAAGCAGSAGELDLPEGQAAWIERLLTAEDARDPGDPLFVHALQSDDPLLRTLAFRALGRMGRAEAAEPVVAALAREAHPEVRAEGFFALGLLGKPVVVDVAERFVLDADPITHAALVRAIGMAGEERGLLIVLDALRHDSAEVRGAAALAVARLLGDRDDPLAGRSFAAFEVLGTCLAKDPSAEVRWRAAYACGKLRRTEFQDRLVAALADSDPRVRLFAAEGLAALPPSESTRDALYAALADDTWQVRVQVIQALGAAPAPEHAAALTPFVASGAEGEPSHHVRAAAVAALAGSAADPAVADVLEGSLRDPSETVRGTALESLAAGADPERVAALLRDVLAHRTPAPATGYLRSRVARAAAALPAEHGLPLVHQLLGAREPAVRAAALEALGSCTDPPGAARVLAEALAEEDVAVRAAAAGAAARLGLQELRPDLARALQASPGPELVEARLALLEALAALAGEEAIPVLRDALQDGELRVRRAARETLARVGGAIPELPRHPPPERAFIPRVGPDFDPAGERPRVRLVTTAGPVTLELLVDEAPHHALLFLDRCRQGFYDGLPFHRLVPGFVVQGLDPRGDGYGTGGASLRNEVNPMRYERGTVGMPDAGLDTGGCQVFITFRPQPRLDARYTVFARVVEGMEAVERLDVGDRVDYVLAAPQSMRSSTGQAR